MAEQITSQRRIVLVTGPSGAGRSTAIHVLEDLGFEAIDNLPMGLLSRLLDGPEPARPMALGIDARNREFSTIGFIELAEKLGRMEQVDLTVLYLDCSNEVLLRRFSETSSSWLPTDASMFSRTGTGSPLEIGFFPSHAMAKTVLS